ncbi:diphosphomevalonate/mevalonate 3,5-bisphosphate decarboxylase family protein [Gramella sp. KN1008]|uniref:diphosphomevalonate/mevalonate 3,5-bisphosphate decarboxylase family protein n=1 Tax=Gramella sp. KN1008 TaxID=2529298 RepID=UPI00103A2121|nr:diphosphomevalonate decarboxylase [Gramella sp. KN1008]TBW29928.1 diphosphomevalonate decarboxylase [Gramella sp. KN1008]
MTQQEFIPGQGMENIESGDVTWQSPSNIALVKYWGKKENQIPANPSISFTLDHCKSTTTLKFSKKTKASEDFDFSFYFKGSKKEDFKPKIQKFLERIEAYCPYLKDYEFEIHSENSFPHSSGIASSASGMSALALCIMDLERKLYPGMEEGFFNRKASFLARLGSGSASRSIEGPLVVWGEHTEIKETSDLYGVRLPYQIHEIFKDYRDTILLVDKGEKKVSSSVGHNLMHGHPFAEKRFEQASRNLERLIPVLRSGNLEEFVRIVESEALTLHAMMMSSEPYFILMKPNTLEIINKIWAYRELTGIPVCFTLDAGANVHLLYPAADETKVLEFIKNELVAYCENGHYICDLVGSGAKKIDNG